MSSRVVTVEDLERASGQELRSSNGASPGPDALCETLTEQLGLVDVHRKVTGATVWGRGEDARVDIHLSGESRPLRFNRFADVGKPQALTTALATQVAVGRTFKVPDAIAICVAVNKLAEHQIESDEDEAAREWGAEYLRVAPTEDVDLADQIARWRAFEALARLEPARQAGDDKSAYGIAAHSLVLIDSETGRRLVRTGWFQAYVKREVGGVYSPAALATQMQRVGWQRPNSEGRIKATCPNDPRTLAWRFYSVPADWSQVPASSPDYARTHTHARGHVDTPAGTWHPPGAANGNGHHANGNGNGAAL
jgi:hypothetical protein